MIAAARHFLLLMLLVACRPASAVVIPDPAFGRDGVVYVTGFEGYGRGYVHLAVTSDQGVVLALSGLQDEANWLVVAKLGADGSLDSSFGGGLQRLPLDDPAQILLTRLLPATDGGVLVVMQRLLKPDQTEAVLLRFDATGKPLASFNGGRPLTIPLPAWSGIWTAHVHGDGYLLTSAPQAGPFDSVDESPARRQPRFFRVTDAGQLDNGFGQSGYREEPAQDGLFGDAVVLPDLRFQILHSVKLVNGQFVNRWRRYLSDGRVDGSSGTGGWIGIGDDGRLQLVNAFMVGGNRAALINSQWKLAGYAAADSWLPASAGFIGAAKVVVPFGENRILVGSDFRSGFIPTPPEGSYVTAVDAAGMNDHSFTAPEQSNALRMNTRINRFNVVADSPSRFVVADYSEYGGFRITRYRELRGTDQWPPIPAMSTITLLALAAIVLAVSVRHRRGTMRRPRT